MDYYVKNGGNDSASGLDDDNAWAYCPGMTSWSGSATLSPGDNVYFKRGDQWLQKQLVVNASGTSGNPITFSAYGSGALPDFDGNGAEFWDGIIKIENRSYITIDSLEIHNVQKQCVYVLGTGSNITIQNSEIHDNITSGYILVYIGANSSDLSYITFTGNTLYNCQHNGIRITGGTDHVVIANNSFSEMKHAGIDTHPTGSGVRSTDLEIYGNDIYAFGNNDTASGIYLPAVDGADVYDNDIHDDYTTNNAHAGIKITWDGDVPSLGSLNITVRQNRIWNIDGNDGSTYGLWFYETDESEAWNNTIYSCRNTMLSTGNTNFSNQNNLAFANANDTTALRNLGYPGSTDPLFVDPTGNPPDFRLQTDSPALDAGTDVGLPYIGDNPDLGAYERAELTYDGNGADSGSQADSTDYAYGDEVTVLDEGSLVKTGYSFVDWNTAAGGGGTAYDPTDTFDIADDVTLYAQWEGASSPSSKLAMILASQMWWVPLIWAWSGFLWYGLVRWMNFVERWF